MNALDLLRLRAHAEGGQTDELHAAIGGVSPALDQAFSLQAIKDPRRR